jgi:hypothetical protein
MLPLPNKYKSLSLGLKLKRKGGPMFLVLAETFGKEARSQFQIPERE